MIRIAACCTIAFVASSALGCDLAREPQDSGRIDAVDGTSIAWRVEPSPLAVDRHFALRIRACANAPISAITVDAQMPEHRHGMNYRPSMTKTADGEWRAEGLLFHMPGKWEITFVVTTAQGVKRHSHALILR